MRWLKETGTSPMSGQPVDEEMHQYFPNTAVKQSIDAFKGEDSPIVTVEGEVEPTASATLSEEKERMEMTMIIRLLLQ